MSFQRRLAEWPWPVTTLVAAVVCIPALLLMGFAYDRADGPNLWPFLIVVAVLAVAVTPIVLAIRRRRLRALGRWEATLAAYDAYRSGRVPADPEVRRELARAVETQRRSLPFYRWGGPLIFGGQALIQVGRAVDTTPRAWAVVALFGGLALAYPVVYRRTRARIARVEAGLAG